MEFRSHSGPETTGLCWQVRRRLKRRSQVRARKWLCSKSVAEQELSARQFPLMSCKSPREIQSYSKSAAQKTRIRRNSATSSSSRTLNRRTIRQRLEIDGLFDSDWAAQAEIHV